MTFIRLVKKMVLEINFNLNFFSWSQTESSVISISTFAFSLFLHSGKVAVELMNLHALRSIHTHIIENNNKSVFTKKSSNLRLTYKLNNYQLSFPVFLVYGWHLLSGTDHCAGHIHIQVWLGRTNTMVDERPVTEMVIKDESECLSGRVGGGDL